MGFRKWIMKHGIGSIGSVAKTMAISYTRFRRAYPFETENEIMNQTLSTRYPEYPKEVIKDMVEISNNNLHALIFLVILNEYPVASRAVNDIFSSVGTEMSEVIDEMIYKYAPDAQK